MSNWRPTVLGAALALVLGASGCSSSPDPVPQNVQSALASIQSKKSEKPSSDAASSTAQPTVEVTTAATPSTDPSVSETSAAAAWARYPWPSNPNGIPCSPPRASGQDRAHTVVVLGDSLIRNSRERLKSDLAAVGFGATFVCVGGMQTSWGVEQLSYMRQLGLLPECLVVNLGTNDMKLDRGHLTAEQLEPRLVELLRATEGVPHVLLVNIWGKQGSLMPDMAPTVPVYPRAIREAGRGQLVDWASIARANPALVEKAGVHDTASGEAERARLISRAVAASCR